MNILVVYAYNDYPLRTTVANHLYAFQRYSEHKCYYINLQVRKLPWYLTHVHFDLVVFHTIFLAQRWSHKEFKRLVARAGLLQKLDAIKVAIPQDEFLNTEALCDFLNEFAVDCVFSVAPQSEWPKIYDTVDQSKVRLYEVLTGYLDTDTIKRINRLAKQVAHRSIDIGYRAWRAEPWLGRHGMLKTQLAEFFQKKAPEQGLNIDISTRSQDTLLGDDWYKFLLKCKYTIGVEGGASILDRNGSIKKRTDDYVAEHPAANFEEIEAACFPGVDGSFSLFAISPRHLEACVTGTCQVLVEGAYNGILQAGEHYIPLSKDFSNVDKVLATIKADDLRGNITEKAYQDIVASKKYTYPAFVRFILEKSLGQFAPSSPLKPVAWVVWSWMLIADALTWRRIALRRKARRSLDALIPQQIAKPLLDWATHTGRR